GCHAVIWYRPVRSEYVSTERQERSAPYHDQNAFIPLNLFTHNLQVLSVDSQKVMGLRDPLASLNGVLRHHARGDPLGLKGARMKSLITKRSIIIGGHKTSVSLEDAFWEAMKEIAIARRTTLSNLVS